MGTPGLFEKSTPWPVAKFNSPELHALLADMKDSMIAATGAGLAAPQIGVDKQLVIFGFKQQPDSDDRTAVPETILINPVITPLSDEIAEAWEGCLSVPGLRGVVPRWSRVRYEGVDQHGVAICREVDGFHARVVQHECDHLDGVLYPMRVVDFSRFGYTSVLFPEMNPDEDD